MDANRNFDPSIADYAAVSSIGLTRGKVARIQNGRGIQLRVESGSVWVTHHGCNDDVILKTGESYGITKDGLTLLTNLNRSFALITLDPAIPAAPTLGERFWKFWAGLYASQSRPTSAAL